MSIDHDKLASRIDAFWDADILPTLTDYIAIPALSVHFDRDWQAHGHLDRVRKLALDWLSRHLPADWTVHAESLPGRTPLILVECPGDAERTVLIYGHLDKQPEMEGWSEGLGPWLPVRRGDKLYGRGGADDGYSLFAAVAALKALAEQRAPRVRAVILIEFSEESGSPDLPVYLDKYADIIGTPELVIALDSGAGDYERLWSTTSLRGMLGCKLTVRVLDEATHSGMASGIIPSSVRVMRQLLDRLEDPLTGELRLPELYAEIPEQRRRQAQAAARILGDSIIDAFSAVPGLSMVSEDPAELLLNNAWRPTLCVVGQDGMPPSRAAGAVMRAYTTFVLSLRLPPTVDYRSVEPVLRKLLTRDAPYGAKIEVELGGGGRGWDAPPLADWLEQATSEASRTHFGADAAYFGIGGSIPFMAMLGEQYPEAQFLITGVLGPKSNAHGPNEFLHIPYAKRLTACVAQIIARHYES